MLTISGLRGVNLVDPARIARIEGLDMMSIIVVLVVAYDNDVTDKRRWFVVLEVPWLAEEDETVPRRLRLV
jgi:hypothetical protein